MSHRGLGLTTTMAPLLPRPHAAWDSRAMVAAPDSALASRPSNPLWAILRRRRCSFTAAAAIETRCAVCTHEGLLLRRAALRSRSCDDCNCGHYVITMSAAAVPPMRLFERRRTRRASPRWAATLQIGAPSQPPLSESPCRRRRAVNDLSSRARRVCAIHVDAAVLYCFIPRTLLLKSYVGCIAKNGPGAQSASGALSVFQLLHPETDPRI